MITEKEVSKIYERLCNIALQKFNKKQYINCLSTIVSSSLWMYNFNIKYYDEVLESVIHRIARLYFSDYNIINPDPNKVVFIDNFGLDNRGLTQQYLRGLMSLNKEILYILHNNKPNINSEIIKELNQYNYSTIRIYQSTKQNILEMSKKILLDIYNFSPLNIFIHIAPWDVLTLLAIDNLKGSINKYNINLTDHAFWLGKSFVDYNIEFRGYGETLSIQKRGFNKSQIISLPYYPIISKYSRFDGFPKLPQDAIIVLCGGAEYKMLGKDGIFFKLMNGILNLSPKVNIIVAGIDKGSTFDIMLSTVSDRNRIHLIGNRKDINEVFSHSDIFLSSYPFIGGLMTQYAAYNRLPILAYAEPQETGTVDSLINNIGNAFCTKRSYEDFIQYAGTLIKNKEFRKSEGNMCHDSMMNEETFNKNLDMILSYSKTEMHFELEQPDYDSIVSFYIDIEATTHNAFKILMKQYKFKTLRLIPSQLPTITKVIINYIKSKIGKSANR